MTKQKKLRHSEYYDMQPVFDKLYSDSKNGKIFTGLMEIISNEENIRLAYRNIKRNSGSNTAGTDKLTIKDIEKLSVEQYVGIVQRKLMFYKPKPVRRVEIPKPNGKMRPLGIPTIIDRLIQQCILQVMEPICEAKFYERSNGFRPNRSAENAIAQCYKMINLQKLYFVVDVDIKGFFDNVNHTKLIQQIWHMGIRDKKLLCIIREMLKAPIVMPDGTVEHPTKGTPQGGILSPLLSNIVLNELDWWIDSQWENMPTKRDYYCEIRPNGTINKTAIYTSLKSRTKLKEVHIIRYADDFKLFCRKRSDAEKVFIAVKLWLQDRLRLEISEEKSKIVNLKRHYSEFLGFEIKAVKKRKRYVVKSHMTPKAIQREKDKLIEQVKQIAHVQDRDDEAREITLYNSMVFGIHNYYRYATMVASDCEQIHRAVSTVMKNRLYGRLSKKGRINEVYIRENYGKSKQIRFISSKTVAPVGYIKTKTPLFKKKKVCKYTPEGREEIHKNLGINTSIMLALMRIQEPRRSVEYMDNRISLYAAQYGRCAVTGKELWLEDIHCHHKLPVCLGGDDRYSNLVIVHRTVHQLIHATAPESVIAYLTKLQLDKKALAKLNALRVMAGNTEI
ncbi:MAG: group II intron reverse transcriptase/maturase [Ruminiclostridium sp.]|nr:group II intron reverse transcriptase/maturase [Ruminiclostridium sp.]